MKEWRAITPHVMSRTNRLLRKMLDFAQDNACYDYVPELWTSNNQNLINQSIPNLNSNSI